MLVYLYEVYVSTKLVGYIRPVQPLVILI